MDIFPFIEPMAMAEEESLPMYREIKWDYKSDMPVFKNKQPVIVSGNEAVKVWIWNALKTERKRYVIYTHNYGSDVEELIGKPYSDTLKSMECERLIEECLIINPYITEVNDIETSFEGDKLIISFTAETIYGSVKMESDSFV
jgi:hypothetical protein